MKQLLISITLVSILALTVLAAPTRGGKCALTTVETNLTSYAQGQTVQVTAHFTNCGNNNLANVGIKVEGYLLPDNTCYTTVIPYVLIASIPAGQTVTLTGSFVPTCTGDWEILSTMHPSAVWSYGEVAFTVTP